MQTHDEHRRKIVKNLLLAGLALQLVPACKTEVEESPPTKPNTQDKIGDDEEKETLETLLASDNVSYYEKSSEEYTQHTTYFNKHVTKEPKVVALVNNTEGVSEAMRYAKLAGLPVSIRSGGHSFELFSSNDGGLVINLSLLKSIEWLEDNKVKIESGVVLGEIYDELLPKNRVLPAGSCGTVGISGLTLGGGYGFFARRYGLTCDQLEAVTFVDAKGEIYEDCKDQELLWALRGGGNGNFGAVSSFTFKTHPKPTHFSNHRFEAYKLDVPRARFLLDTYFRVTKELPDDGFAAFVLNGTTLTLLITYYESNSGVLAPVVEELSLLTDKHTESTGTDIGSKLKGYYGATKSLYFKNASAGYYKGMETINECLDEVLELSMSNGLIYQINTLGGQINNASFEQQSSYPHREWPYLSELQCYWTEGQNAKRDKMITAFQKVQDVLYDAGVRTQYRNYPHAKFKDWEYAYFGENYPRLQKTKRKYDPDDRIQHPQSIKC